MLSVAAAYGVEQSQVRIAATGNIKAVGLGVYSDQACTGPLSSIDWGLLEPGASKTTTFYLKSTSNVNASLALSESNWVPVLASGYISLSWNRESYRTRPGEVVSVTLILQVSSSIQGVNSFSFDAIITASEVSS